MVFLDKLFGLEELPQMSHLPQTGAHENGELSNGPPEDALIGRFTSSSEALLSKL